jgi:hypothetical protein
MIRFATMIDRLPGSPSAWDDYAAQVAEPDRAAAHALLSGQRPRRIAGLDAIIHWAAEVAGVPDWLMQASLAASGDKAEVAALLLPPPVGAAPGVAEVVDRLARTTRISAHATLLSLWSTLPPAANLLVNRLASGTFRTGFPVVAQTLPGPRLQLRVVMVMADPLRAQVTVALWDQGVAVPVARVAVAAPDRAELMAWVRANATQRFGPQWQVPPQQVFDLEFDGLARNLRRKSRHDLIGPVLGRWRRDLTGDQADQTAALQGLFARQSGDTDRG